MLIIIVINSKNSCIMFWDILAFYLANILALFLAYLLAFYLTFYLAYLLAFYLAVEVQWCPLSSEGLRLRSSSAHWARKVPGWGLEVPTAFGTLRLRSSRAHSDRQPAVEVQLAEEIGDELARPKWTWKLMQTWLRRNWRRRKRRWQRRRTRRRRRRTSLIKSTNPHLAGGDGLFRKLQQFWFMILLRFHEVNAKQPTSQWGPPCMG